MEWEITWSGLLSTEVNLVTANIGLKSYSCILQLGALKVRIVCIFAHLFKTQNQIRETKTIKSIFVKLSLDFLIHFERIFLSLWHTRRWGVQEANHGAYPTGPQNLYGIPDPHALARPSVRVQLGRLGGPRVQQGHTWQAFRSPGLR